MRLDTRPIFRGDCGERLSSSLSLGGLHDKKTSSTPTHHWRRHAIILAGFRHGWHRIDPDVLNRLKHHRRRLAAAVRTETSCVHNYDVVSLPSQLRSRRCYSTSAKARHAATISGPSPRSQPPGERGVRDAARQEPPRAARLADGVNTTTHPSRPTTPPASHATPPGRSSRGYPVQQVREHRGRPLLEHRPADVPDGIPLEQQRPQRGRHAAHLRRHGRHVVVGEVEEGERAEAGDGGRDRGDAVRAEVEVGEGASLRFQKLSGELRRVNRWVRRTSADSSVQMQRMMRPACSERAPQRRRRSTRRIALFVPRGFLAARASRSPQRARRRSRSAGRARSAPLGSAPPAAAQPERSRDSRHERRRKRPGAAAQSCGLFAWGVRGFG